MPNAKAMILWFLFSAVLHQVAVGQMYDRAWLVGGSNTTVKLTLNGNTMDTASFYWATGIVDLSGASADVSDTGGNILFYSNGAQVATGMAQVMENGDTLTDSAFYSMFPGGFVQPQTNLILPKSGNTFYLFYYSESDSLMSQNIAEPDRLYYAVIDMDSNGGLGKVISKKNVAYAGMFFGDGRLTACRHANGRDWWMVHPGWGNNEYFIYLVTPNSVYPPKIQYIGPSGFYNDNYAAQSCFSPDGSKFATTCIIGPLAIMDFDRCAGVFSNPDSIAIPLDTAWYNGAPSAAGGGGGGAACFSPSGRFLYMSDELSIYQYDTWASNIANTITVIGRWDTVGPIGGDYGFGQMYLLPNGQIIIDNVTGGSDFQLIDSPDLRGVGCNFRFNALPTYTLEARTLPNMINYQLGALAGSGCDTLTGIKNTVSQGMAVKVYPNPASDIVFVDAPGRDLSETLDFVMYDMLGQEILRQNIPLYEIEVPRNNISSGIYTWQLQNTTGQVKATGKIVWE